jgi:hypothetical protein
MVMLCIVGDIINFLFQETIKSGGIFYFRYIRGIFLAIFRIVFHDKQNDSTSKQNH